MAKLSKVMPNTVAKLISGWFIIEMVDEIMQNSGKARRICQVMVRNKGDFILIWDIKKLAYKG